VTPTSSREGNVVKLVCFLKRREGLSREEFFDHWLNRHGPLIASTEPFASLVKRYEQHPRVPEPAWMGTAGYDGVTIQWFDSTADVEAFVGAPEYASVLAPDEASFLDTDALVWMITEEPTTPIDGPTEP
jgi:uncharacterized protein (TIGR02118 family)